MARAGAAHDDYTVSPVVRQTLLHWGYELTRRDADAYARSSLRAGVLALTAQPIVSGSDDSDADEKPAVGAGTKHGLKRARHGT